MTVKQEHICLNPYCSGIWSRRLCTSQKSAIKNLVLILIVVEYGLGVRLDQKVDGYVAES